ncbi:MAG: sigma-70 family RNA polymerase sigma factor [Burkholderiales bacterium]|nr:sigma-70 family RNA polymerase sigma factor [Opitutaceae bacterium]
MSPAPPAPGDPELERLTTGLARGDESAWVRFHVEHGPALFRRLLAATRGDADLAREALQLTYLRVARHARRSASPVEFATWLRLVARSALSDARRRRRSFFDLLRRREADPVPWLAEADDPATDQRLETALDLALTRLDADEHALIQGKYFQGHDVRALVDRLGLTPKAVESRFTRARAALRTHLLSDLSRHEPA